ncbi:MAG: Flp pilus assembly protein CpaB [Dehalococcoidia bacterium]
MAGQTMTRPRADKTQRYVFFLGLALAAIAAIVVFVAVNGGGEGGGNIAVVTANEAIPAQTRITEDMLKVQYLDPGTANADAFSSRSQIVDRVVTEDVAAGTQILPSMVSENTGDGLTFKLDPGMRGVSVEVQEVVIAGGNIKPGDRVDVVGVFEVDSVDAANHLLTQLGTAYTVKAPKISAVADEQQQTLNTYVLTVTLLQNVKVLGLAQTLTTDTAGGSTLSDEVDDAQAEPNAATATFEVTPAQTQALTLADEYGILRASARGVGDDDTADVAPTIVTLNRAR